MPRSPHTPVLLFTLWLAGCVTGPADPANAGASVEEEQGFIISRTDGGRSGYPQRQCLVDHTHPAFAADPDRFSRLLERIGRAPLSRAVHIMARTPALRIVAWQDSRQGEPLVIIDDHAVLLHRPEAGEASEELLTALARACPPPSP